MPSNRIPSGNTSNYSQTPSSGSNASPSTNWQIPAVPDARFVSMPTRQRTTQESRKDYLLMPGEAEMHRAHQTEPNSSRTVGPQSHFSGYGDKYVGADCGVHATARNYYGLSSVNVQNQVGNERTTDMSRLEGGMSSHTFHNTLIPSSAESVGFQEHGTGYFHMARIVRDGRGQVTGFSHTDANFHDHARSGGGTFSVLDSNGQMIAQRGVYPHATTLSGRTDFAAYCLRNFPSGGRFFYTATVTPASSASSSYSSNGSMAF